MKQSERMVIMLTPKERIMLKALADTNTSGNQSELLRSLIRRAYMMPGEFGLLDPDVFPKSLALQPTVN